MRLRGVKIHHVLLTSWVIVVVFIVVMVAYFASPTRNTYAGGPAVYLSAKDATVSGKLKVKISGYTVPRQAGVTVNLYRQYIEEGSVKKIATVRTNAYGNYTYYANIYRTAYYKATATVMGKTVKMTKKYYTPFERTCATSTMFAHYPVDLSSLNSILPLGNSSPSGHVFPTGHIYFFLNRSIPGDWNSAPVQANVYAPGTTWITSITVAQNVTDGYTDYAINFQSCGQIKSNYGHVSSLSRRLRSYLAAPYVGYSDYSTGGKRYITYTKKLALKITSGEVIGTAGGRIGQNALDFGTTDTRHPLSFANNSRWSSTTTRYAACPVNYYTSTLRPALNNRFGYNGTTRVTAPVCGTVAQDIAGTAQGAWFKVGASNMPEDPHLALIHDNVTPALGEFSVGTGMSRSGLDAGKYTFTPAGSGNVNRDFAGVTANGQVYCYEPNDRNSDSRSSSTIILLKMNSSTSLRMEKQNSASCGDGPWSWEGNYTDYIR